MSVISIREQLDARGLTGSVSVMRDFYGYITGRAPVDPDGNEASTSVRSWAATGKDLSFNLNVILVGADAFTAAMLEEIDTALYWTRRTYDGVSVGIKWVTWHSIPVEDADGHDVIESEDEIDDMLSGWAIDNDAIDLYFPAGWAEPNGLLGRSVINGPLPGHKNVAGSKGSCVGLNGVAYTSRTTPHELGHYLSLQHRYQDASFHSKNLMTQTKFVDDPTWHATALEFDQINDVWGHGMVFKEPTT